MHAKSIAASDDRRHCSHCVFRNVDKELRVCLATSTLRSVSVASQLDFQFPIDEHVRLRREIYPGTGGAKPICQLALDNTSTVDGEPATVFYG